LAIGHTSALGNVHYRAAKPYHVAVGGSTIMWIVIGVVAVALFAIGLFRARRGWSGTRPRSAREAHSEADAAAWVSKLDKQYPNRGA
jgi:hypothetical protein